MVCLATLVDSRHKLRGDTKNTESPYTAAIINETNVRAKEEIRFTGYRVGRSGSSAADP